MGTVSQLQDRLRPAAHRIDSEEEAIAAARSLAADFRRESSERDINRALPYAEIEALSLSGVTALTVPPEYEGLDVSNSLLAEIVAIIAEGDASIGHCLAVHFTALENLRLNAGEDLKAALFSRVLAGDRFAPVVFGPEAISTQGLGHRITGRSLPAPGVLFADWFAVSAQTDEPVLYLARGSEGLQTIDDWDGFGQRTNGTATLVATNVHASADATIRDGTPAATLGLLLQASVDLGIARAALSALSSEEPLAEAAGRLVVGAEAASALLERAGRKLDIAQINNSTRALADAEFSACAARAYASELARETAAAIFEISQKDISSIGLNLDRHWRNARIRAAGNTVSSLHGKAAELYSELAKS